MTAGGSAPERGGPLVLAIESSCDETAAAVLDGWRSLRSSVVHSQIPVHAQYGGVVPELASRNHVVAINGVVQRALDEAACTVDDLGAVAVTRAPGLVGSLLVGIEFAKGIGLVRDIPVVGVHHLAGHLMAPFLEVAEGFAEPGWPFVGLIVSGGHTSLVLSEGPDRWTTLGRTLDDAAGEAYDKVSKRLGLGYPGGAVLDRIARSGRADAWDVPRPMVRKPGYDFSFSGIKTWVAHHLAARGPLDDPDRADLVASFQEAVAETLVIKTLRAVRDTGVRRVVISGGVAANGRLRALMLERCARRGVDVVAPPLSLCTDNAAMIGAAGYGAAWRAIRAGRGFDGYALDASSSEPIDRSAAATG